jgi:hypothetical protein
MSVMARCAATPRICESAKAVTAWMTVAAPAASAIGISRSVRPLPMTSSMSHLDEAGRTSPDTRPMSIRPRPMARRRRWCQISSRASRQAAERGTFFVFDGSMDDAGTVLRRMCSPVPGPAILI